MDLATACTKVSSLIDVDTGQWDLAPIQENITHEEQEAIRAIPLRLNRGEDRLIWPYEKTGRATVKSVYHRLRELNEAEACSGPSTSRSVSSTLWKEIWSMATQPAMKSFIWRALSNALAVGTNLKNRRIRDSSLCSFCEEEESVEHALLLCKWVQPVWFGSLGMRFDPAEISTIGDWLEFLLMETKNQKTERARIWSLCGFTVWNIWRERCRAWRPSSSTCSSHRDKSLCSLRILECNGKKSKQSPFSPTRLKPTYWKKARPGAIKINCDGAWDASSKRGGIGVVARDETGALVGGRNDSCVDFGADIIEARALLSGVELAIEKGWNTVEFESDAEAVINAIKNPSSKIDWRLDTIVDNIRLKAQLIQETSWCSISRKANLCADWVALQSRKGMCSNDWVGEPPSPLLSLLLFERDYVPP